MFEGIALVLAIAAGIFVYFIPTFIAKSRKHKSFGWILFLNLFFGWTVLLWVALILWAGLGDKKQIRFLGPNENTDTMVSDSKPRGEREHSVPNKTDLIPKCSNSKDNRSTLRMNANTDDSKQSITRVEFFIALSLAIVITIALAIYLNYPFKSIETAAERILSKEFTFSSIQAADLYKEARKRLLDGRYQESLPFIKNALLETKTDSERRPLKVLREYAFIRILESLHQDGQWSQSVSLADKFVLELPDSKRLKKLQTISHRENIPASARSLFKQALKRQQEGSYKEAVALYSQVLPNLNGYYSELADNNLKLCRQSISQALFDQARKKQQASAYDEAITLYSQALPHLTTKYSRLAKNHIESCRQMAFDQYYEAAKNAHNEARWEDCLEAINKANYYQSGNVLLGLWKEEAVKQRVAELLSVASQLTMERQDNTPHSENIMSVYQQILELDSSNSEALAGMQTICDYYRQHGRTPNSEKNISIYQQVLKQILSQEPGNSQALAGMQTIYDYYHRHGGSKVGQMIRISIGKEVYLDLVWIPPGKFIMGSPLSKYIGDAEKGPQHRVQIVRGLWMGKYEVTQAQWQAIEGNNPSRFKTNSVHGDFLGMGGTKLSINTENFPVEYVSWRDCQSFLEELSQKTRLPFRLPTEAEWEYACRAGTTTPFHFGESIYSSLYGQANFGETHHRINKTTMYQGTVKVGSYPPNNWGLYDMHGNVEEFCADNWHDNYNGAPSDGSAWGSSKWSWSGDCVLRGGSWKSSSDQCRSASRTSYPPVCLFSSPEYNFDYIGFRVVLPLLTSPPAIKGTKPAFEDTENTATGHRDTLKMGNDDLRIQSSEDVLRSLVETASRKTYTVDIRGVELLPGGTRIVELVLDPVPTTRLLPRDFRVYEGRLMGTVTSVDVPGSGVFKLAFNGGEEGGIPETLTVIVSGGHRIGKGTWKRPFDKE